MLTFWTLRTCYKASYPETSNDILACEQALGGKEGETKEEGLYAHLRFSWGPATEIIINTTLVADFVTFNSLTCKNYLHLSIKFRLNNRNTIYQNKVYWQNVF